MCLLISAARLQKQHLSETWYSWDKGKSTRGYSDICKTSASVNRWRKVKVEQRCIFCAQGYITRMEVYNLLTGKEKDNCKKH
jgi:hypothetical protein